MTKRDWSLCSPSNIVSVVLQEENSTQTFLAYRCDLFCKAQTSFGIQFFFKWEYESGRFPISSETLSTARAFQEQGIYIKCEKELFCARCPLHIPYRWRETIHGTACYARAYITLLHTRYITCTRAHAPRPTHKGSDISELSTSDF